MTAPLPKALFEASLSYNTAAGPAITKEEANTIFQFFQQHPLFRWSDAQNDCEDRANAICLLLNSWQIPNYKGWVFGGAFLKKTTGSLVNFWNYHVAAALPVQTQNGIAVFIIDPATTSSLAPVETWADAVTHEPCSYYLVRQNDDYIFHPQCIDNNNWYKQNGQNFKWTMQGLAGINGVTRTGKAQLVFNKNRVRNAEQRFKKLRSHKPF